jgi:sialidase-1
MKRFETVCVLAILLSALSLVWPCRSLAAEGVKPFEEVLAVKMARGVFGPRGGMGDFLMLKDGQLMMTYTDDRSIMATKSPDQGKTWDKPFVLIAKPQSQMKGGFCHSSFLRLANGDVLLSYIFSTDAEPAYGHNYLRISSDDGKTWTEQFIATPHQGCVYAHNDRLMALSTGRLVSIAEYRAYSPANDHAGFVGLAFYSDDQGQSWWPSKNTVDMYPVEVQEADAVELKDKQLLMFGRSYSGHPVRAYSNDGGQTWSKGELIKELTMQHASFPSVRRLPSTGDLLFVWGSEQAQVAGQPTYPPRRCTLTAAISQDEGKTFIHQQNIARDPEDDFGYQCIEFVGNDLAIIGYHCRDGIRVARIGIDWFYQK